MKKFWVLFLLVLPLGCKDPQTAEAGWDEIIAGYEDGPTVDFMKAARLNLALAETGQLADKVFHYTQAGYGGIIPPWAQTVENGELLSNIYWSMGHIAYAQRMAMETNVLDDRKFNPAMIRRLVETNLVYGAYEVAGKYLRILETDRSSRDFVKKYKDYLYNDNAVDADPVLGPKKKCIPEKDFISLVRGIDEDLKDIIRINPSYHKAVEYLGTIYLLECEIDRGYWKEVGVSSAEYKRYTDFKSRLENGLSMDRFTDTFWYYIMKVNTL